MTTEELELLIPADKLDTVKAKQLVALGYPTIAPVLEDMLMWSLEPHPVALVFRDFLESLNEELVPALTHLLVGYMSDQDTLKSILLTDFVESNQVIAKELCEVLKYLADSNHLLLPKKKDGILGEIGEMNSPIPHLLSMDSYPSIHALGILIKFNLVETEWAIKVLNRKNIIISHKMKDVEDLKGLLA